VSAASGNEARRVGGPEVLTATGELFARLDAARASGRTVGLVPTLGALHGGHTSLIEAARRAEDLVAVSVFLNPLQFGDPADFAAYPRDLESDVAIALGAGADIVFAPSVAELYPGGEPEVTVDPGPLGAILEGESRPGHFRGVATVVTKLFALFSPCRAYFGEKDYQQLTLIRRLASGLSLRTEVVGCPTVRAEDGLALSSRNARMSIDERAAATVLHRALVAGRARLVQGSSASAAEAEMARVVALEPLAALDYAVVRDAASLGPPGPWPLRLLIAVRVGPVRLIDNLAGPER